MKYFFKSLILASTLAFASNASAALVGLDFTNIAMETGSSFTYSTAGDVWRATNVRMDGGPAMDALFTITGTTGVVPASVAFVNEPERGNNMRVRVGVPPGTVTNAAVFITISFVNSTTTTPYTGWDVSNTLIAQFSDLDSDVGNDRSDFAGARTSQILDSQTSDNVIAGTSLLDLVTSPTIAPDYTIGIMQTPWTPQGNVTDTSAAAQSPVTAAFSFNAGNSIDIVVGQQSNGSFANRHIDIDMTPDFIIIPEPGTALLGSIGFLMLLRRRR